METLFHDITVALKFQELQLTMAIHELKCVVEVITIQIGSNISNIVAVCGFLNFKKTKQHQIHENGITGKNSSNSHLSHSTLKPHISPPNVIQNYTKKIITDAVQTYFPRYAQNLYTQMPNNRNSFHCLIEVLDEYTTLLATIYIYILRIPM